MSMKRILIFAMVLLLLGTLFAFERNGFLTPLLPEKSSQIAPNIAQQPLSEIDINISVEVKDLLKLVYALDRYKQINGSYPISSSNGKKWDGIISSYGESREDWIRGLVPEYVDRLPQDPRMLDDGTRQYIYKSDGANYKLIVHRAANCELIKNSFPSLVDPVRDCFSFGFWTKRAARW